MDVNLNSLIHQPALQYLKNIQRYRGPDIKCYEAATFLLSDPTDALLTRAEV